MPSQYMSLHTNAAEHAQRNLTLFSNFTETLPQTKDHKSHSLHQADYCIVSFQFLFHHGIESIGHIDSQFNFFIVCFQQHEHGSSLQNENQCR